MKRIALALAALVLTGGFAVAVPLVAGGAASAEYTACVDNSLMQHDHDKVQKDKAAVKAQQAKVKKIAHQRPKTDKAEAAKMKHLKGAKRKLARDKNRLRHDEEVYGRDVPCDPPSDSSSASPSAGASASTSTSPSPSTSTDPITGVVCGLLPIC